MKMLVASLSLGKFKNEAELFSLPISDDNVILMGEMIALQVFRNVLMFDYTDAHISSWAGRYPRNNESAPKRRSGKTRKGNTLLRSTLVVCAHSAVQNKNSHFPAQFQRISAHRGKKRAYVAVAHSMVVAIYHILKDGVVFQDLGEDITTNSTVNAK